MKNREEYEELLKIAKEIYYRLEQAENELKASKRWGIADLFFNNMFLGWIKRNRMSDADYFLNRVEQLTIQFQEKLQDIHMDFKNNLLKSEKGKIWDIFFDNLFSDLFTHRRIEITLNQIEAYKPKIEQIIQYLENEISSFN